MIDIGRSIPEDQQTPLAILDFLPVILNYN